VSRRLPRHLGALRHTRRPWLVATVVAALAVLSVWASLAITPPASVHLGVVKAEISAAPGSGTVVRTALGRPVTDDTINAGPLQVQVALAVTPHPQASEPQVLAAIDTARPRVVQAAVLYLVRVTLGAVVIALVCCALVFGRRPRRLVLGAVVTMAVVGGGVGATAATTHLAGFDAASCAHGWSRYALADVPDLSPPAPAVTPPPDATAAANAGLLSVLLIADDHLNPEGLVFAHRIQQSTGAVAVLDAGDTTSYGVPGEACIVAPLIRSFNVPYVWVRGNHDSTAFERAMRSTRGVRVLDGTTTNVAGLTVFGIGDPSFTPRRHHSSQTIAGNADALRATIDDRVAATGTTPDVALVHECRMAASGDPANPGVAGSVPVVLCGHTHRYSAAAIDGTTVLHTGTVGAGGLAAFSEGELRDFGAVLLFFSADTHELVRYYVVDGSGGQTATFTGYGVTPPAAPLETAGPPAASATAPAGPHSR